MAAIDVQALCKNYGAVTALDNMEFSVRPGEAFGLLGPNGAGKSTLIRILSTLEQPTSGVVRVAGLSATADPRAVRRRIGVALQETGVDGLMTGRELLLLAARLFGHGSASAKQRVDALLDRFQLGEVAGRRVNTYSGGMRRRLDLAVALVHEPDIIVLDEPTTGLDPVNRLALWDLLRRLSAEEGRTVLMTTQYLEEADALCDRVLFINRGRIVAEGSPSDLKREAGSSVVRFTVPGAAAEAVRSVFAARGWELTARGASFEWYSATPESDVVRMDQALKAYGLNLSSLEVRPPSLDDVFLHLTGWSTDKEAAQS